MFPASCGSGREGFAVSCELAIVGAGGASVSLNEIEDMLARMAMGDRRALSALYDVTSAKLSES